MQIGIDLGGTHIAVGVISEKDKIVAKKEIDIFIVSPSDYMKDYILDNIKQLISEVIKKIGAPSCVISKIGIAIPGKVKDNIAYDIFNLGIDEFDICSDLEKTYSAKVSIRNDAKCAALAEKKIGSLKDYDDCVFLCLGTGIGGATFINGKMVEYTKEWGSEYGHMIIEKNGLECKCGNKGCYEQYASMRAFKNGIIKLLNLPENTDSEEILKILIDKVDKNDRQINIYINEYLENVIIGLSNIINIVQPEAICIGGSFVYFEKILFNKLIEKMNTKKFNGQIPKIVLASLQNDAGMVGSLM